MVENIFALRHAQEACTLLKRLRAELRHLFYGGAGRIGAVFLAVNDDIFRDGAVHA